MQGAHVRMLASVLALALAISVWVVEAGHLGEPIRAIDVVAFLTAPALLAACFVRGLGPLETAVTALAAATVTIGILAAITFLAASWTPRSALLALSAVVGLAAAVELVRSARRQVGDDAP